MPRLRWPGQPRPEPSATVTARLDGELRVANGRLEAVRTLLLAEMELHRPKVVGTYVESLDGIVCQSCNTYGFSCERLNRLYAIYRASYGFEPTPIGTIRITRKESA